MKAAIVLIVMACTLCARLALAQDLPALPVTLDYADSVVGVGPLESGIRRFEGNVRFRQGNVTVTCDRAIHDIPNNAVTLLGNVVVVQDSLSLFAPKVVYDGNNALATATGGIRVLDRSREIRALSGTYGTRTRIIRFASSVHAVDDSLVMSSDTLVYNRTSRRTDAWGNVVVMASDTLSWMAADTLVHEPQRKTIELWGHARQWVVSPAKDSTQYGPDTLNITADTILMSRLPFYYQVARGRATMVRGSLAARGQVLELNDSLGTILLLNKPVLWSDSMMLRADTITIQAPQRIVKEVVGNRNALLVSRGDSSYTSRFDQIAGDDLRISIAQDTVRSMVAAGNTRSIYFRFEQQRPEGLAQFSADTTVVEFEKGIPENIRWLGTVRGEQHPENIVAGARDETYRLPDFEWRTDRPVLLSLPQVIQLTPVRQQSLESPRRSL
jgi:lipopolysaccharide export system protein LptA